MNNWNSNIFHSFYLRRADRQPCVWICLPHLVVLLWRGEDSLVSYINFAKWPASITLLVEQRHGCHDDGANYYGLAVGDDGLLCHHVTHILYIPATIKIKDQDQEVKASNGLLRIYSMILNPQASSASHNLHIPLVWRCYARWAAFHWEHVDSCLSCGEKATEAQERANCHRWRCSAILQEQKVKEAFKDTAGVFFFSLSSTYVRILNSSFLELPILTHLSMQEVTYQTVYYTDVPLVLLEP